MPGLGVAGYAIAAVGYAALFLLLLVAWAGRGPGVRLVVATAVTAAWAATLAFLASREAAPGVPVFLVEVTRNAAWLVVLAGLVQTGGFPSRLAQFSYAAWLGALAAGIGAFLVGSPAGFYQLAVVSGLLLPLVGLVMLEQIYRNASSSGRWALKLLYLGLGIVFVYDVFLYSQALLLGGVTEEVWFARGYVAAVAIPFLALAARRNPAWSLEVFVSRDAVFYATSFMVVGLYLVVMAAGGYAVRFLGGSWGLVLEIVFFAGALAVLGLLVGSTALRRRLKVFLVKHFYRHKYEYREEWLRFIATLSEGAEQDPRATGLKAIAQIIESPAAVLIRHEQGRNSEATGWPTDAIVPGGIDALAANPALTALLGDREWVVDLEEYRADRDEYEQAALPDWLVASREWRLIVPVLLGRRLLGMILLKNPPDGFSLTFEDRDLLKTVARHVATHLAQHESERRLAEARQFEAYNRLTAFMMHDLKNSVAQLQLIVTNAARHKHNPEFVDDAIETVGNTAARISRLIEQLRRGEAPAVAEEVPVIRIVSESVERSRQRSPIPRAEIEAPDVAVFADRERLTDVLEHVIRNAQEATPADGHVTVRVATADGHAVIEVADDGAGMTPEFVRERLFRPFDSTKGSKGMGIGAYQARELARALGGDVEVESIPGRGTTFRIILPAAAQPASP